MADSKLRDLSTDFAVKVIKMCDKIKIHIERCLVETVSCQRL